MAEEAAYGKTVWSWHPWLVSSWRRFAKLDRAMRAANSPAMEARGIRLQGERGISCKPIARGMPGCFGCTCMLVCAFLSASCTRDRGCQPAPGIPCAMGLRLIPCSPWRRIPFASIAGGLKVFQSPVGFLKTSAGLTPATGARTTRLCRPLFTPFVGARPSLMSKLTLQRRVARPACRGHRSPHPTSVTIAIRPSCGRGMAGVVRVIWGQREAEYF